MLNQEKCQIDKIYIFHIVSLIFLFLMRKNDVVFRKIGRFESN